MSNTQFSPSIDSRPTYAGLTSQGAAPAIMVADGPGAAALFDLAKADPSVMDKAHIVLVGATPEDAAKALSLAPLSVHEATELEAAGLIFDQLLAEAKMGTVLYLAGSEGVIGFFSAAALTFGLPAEAILSEHRGTIARRIQCVHCKGITEGVTTDPFTCSGCGLTLFVRDHFSRRLGVFQGVCVDAETPGIVPDTQEIRP